MGSLRLCFSSSLSWLLFLSTAFMASIPSCKCSASRLQLNDDVLGLIVFKSGLVDPTSRLTSWNGDDESPCSWKYVQCDPGNGRVIQLSLDGLGLSGKIGRGLEKLQHLRDLSLSRNNLSGGISPDLGRVLSLRRLDLSYNSFSGTIPDEFTNLTTIRFLDFSGNSLSGTIQEQFFAGCVSLQSVSLSGNLLEGPIPSTLAQCVSLGALNLSDNHLSGNPDFSNAIWSLRKIGVLDLSKNMFTGPVPVGIALLHSLKELHLEGNQFEGPLPADIGLCPHLVHLDLSHNMFSGVVPDSLQMLTSLSFLSLANNRLTGDFPPWIGTMSSLQLLDVSNNELTGNLSDSLGDLRLLNSLIVSSNRLTGEVPEAVKACTGLSEIKLKGNNFNGSIPAGLFDLGLRDIDLSANGFTGSIPAGSSQLFESLTFLDLSKNGLSGTIPPEMGLYLSLRYLNLSWNNLHSRLPPELGLFRNLSALDLRNSGLYGLIPDDLCEYNSLSVLQLDGNSLSGPIPEGIGNCSSLSLLTLSHNNLSESIPEAISWLKKLKILKLEFNNLSGEIPQELGNSNNLLAVNVSHNRLVGQLPRGGIFPSLDKTALQGNLGLCSPLLVGPCKMHVPKPLVLDPNAVYKGRNGGDAAPSASDSRKHRHPLFLSVSAIIAISAATIILTGVLVVSLLNVSARKRLAFIETAMEGMRSLSPSPRSAKALTGRLVLFSTSESRYEDWVVHAESLLTKASEIGRGVFGTVYKASLGEGRTVVIKKLITSNIIQNQDDFDREVRILGKAKHPNVMTLQGYYWTQRLQLLITDFAPNGSLYSQLHERGPSTPSLPWPTRFKIVAGTAKGLAYLHQCRPPIVHYSIKPSNILLDENFNPKVSDYGLARLLTSLDRHVPTSRFQTAVGYVAPELACQSLRINEKCDVYGFGVMILELVTGRRPVQYGEDDVVVLTDHVRVLLEQGNPHDCIDPRLSDYQEDELVPLLKLGLVCTSQIPSSRPSMTEVDQILQVIKTPLQHTMEVY
ncbi:probably inactive leucine-rich repeat receptor-like protein kinase At3g28040 [Aristolochia californica]|uniref:probably inactive leucine-rich repeat receptor-like protein kinase At3g28040 n=1 Tax=Aristolochia californica TaxID=171875 RepID=UPI0035D550CD